MEAMNNNMTVEDHQHEPTAHHRTDGIHAQGRVCNLCGGSGVCGACRRDPWAMARCGACRHTGNCMQCGGTGRY